MIERTREWIYADDWNGFKALVVAQIITVGAFFWFAIWISDYAKLNWY
jgi:hypothetical protein